ncbi:MAG TPA: LysR family transcriptional regulator [Pseudonocardia sp.]|jgi:DNA-binding transcriptional LysR family regulator|nr:LysR family transcriptional regulator [Pseudonocardia sp.]
MSRFTLHELQCFDAVVVGGGFQAAAELLHRSHPSVFAAVAKLEHQLGLTLLDRSGYRVDLTDAGRAFHRKVGFLLREAEELHTYAAQLAMGEEAELRVVLGDLCPLAPVLELLGEFFAHRPSTQLHLGFEAVTGPWERLFDDDADVVVHRVPPGDLCVESIALGAVALVPVVAPGFLPFPRSTAITPARMQTLTQCVMRDSARHSGTQGYFLVDGAPRCSVPDHLMKKEVIMQAMAWGHLPRFLIEEELRDGRLLSIAGQHFPGVIEELAVVRRSDRPRGPVADLLWDFLAGHAPVLAPTLGRVPRASGDSQEPGRIER